MPVLYVPLSYNQKVRHVCHPRHDDRSQLVTFEDGDPDLPLSLAVSHNPKRIALSTLKLKKRSHHLRSTFGKQKNNFLKWIIKKPLLT